MPDNFNTLDVGFALVSPAISVYGGAEQIGAAANFSHVQIFNPAGSGKKLWLKRAFGMASANAGIFWNRHDTALTTLARLLTNKQAGGAASVMQVRIQNNGAILGTTIGFLGFFTGGPHYESVMHEPCVLSAGQGLLFVAGTVNVSVEANFEGIEF